ncbi:MAG: zinc-ribbon domain-containing protein [Desulfobacterium sp.]
MIIICENCTAKFNLDESLLNPKGSRVRCSQCAHLFLAFPKGYGPEKTIPPAMEVKESSTEEVAPLKPDESIDEPPHAPVSESVETKLESPQTELDSSSPSPSPSPSPENTLESDDIGFDADLDLDFSDTDFDFDEIGLDLDDPASGDASDLADETLTQEAITPHDTEDDLDFDLELDFDIDMELGLDDPAPDDAGDMHDETLTPKAITPHDIEDDLELELDLDLDMELGLDDPAPNDAGDMHDETLTQEAITPHDIEDDLELELDLDLDMELGLDDPAPDDAGDMHDETLTQKAITPHDIEDDLELELDLDLDMELGLDDPAPNDADDMHDETLTQEAITPHDIEDDLELDLDMELNLDMELELDDSSQDVPDNMEDEFNLELDLDKDNMPATPDETQAPDSPPATMDDNDLPLIQEQEKPRAKKDIPKEPGDDTPIAAPSSTTGPRPQYPPLGIEKKSSPIVKLFVFFILLLILLLGAHAASLMTGITIPFVSDLNIPFLTELVTPEPPPPPPIRLIPDKKSINGRFEINQKEGTLFVITGNIHNTSQVTCTNVRVTGSLIDTKKAKIKSKTVVCGVTIPAQQLATLELSAMDKTLSNSDPQTSFPLAPGQYSPFMIIFSKLPDNLENFTVTVDKFDKK